MTKTRLKINLLLALAATLLTAGIARAVGPVLVYSNDMNTIEARSQISQFGAGQCKRGGSDTTFKVKVGKRTPECDFRTPVIGRDLQMLTTAKLLSGTPRKVARRIFVGLNLRAGDGGAYQFVVYPVQHKFALRRITSDGKTLVMANGNASSIQDLNRANRIRLLAFTRSRGETRLLGYVNGKKLATATDSHSGELSGRFSTFTVGSSSSATGAVAIFDDVALMVPDPFATG